MGRGRVLGKRSGGLRSRSEGGERLISTRKKNGANDQTKISSAATARPRPATVRRVRPERQVRAETAGIFPSVELKPVWGVAAPASDESDPTSVSQPTRLRPRR